MDYIVIFSLSTNTNINIIETDKTALGLLNLEWTVSDLNI